LREIEEGVMGVELRSKGTEGVDVDLILDNGSVGGTVNLPMTARYFSDFKRAASMIFGTYPIHELREVAHLIESVPDGKLEVAIGAPGRKKDLHLDQVLLPKVKDDGVANVRREAVRRCD
jgi:hypothetical protein